MITEPEQTIDTNAEPVADKFNGNYEELRKSYDELERKLGAQSEQQQSSQSSEVEPRPLAMNPTVEEHDNQHLENLKKQYGSVFGEYFESYMKKGSLSEKQFADLERKGFNRSVVEHLIDVENRAAVAMLEQQQREEKTLKDVVGGEQAYTNMVAWAQKSLSADEIEAFDSLMESGTRAQKQFAIEAMNARFSKSAQPQQQTSSEPKRVVTGTRPVGLRPYRSQHEVIEDMNNPRYAQDPAFRADVEQRLLVSNF